MTKKEIIAGLQSLDTAEISRAIAAGKADDEIIAIIDLYESIWGMTYGCSHDASIIKMSIGAVEARMALLNEQEDLMPEELCGVEWVKKLDLGGFEEAVLFPELLRYRRLRRLELWDNGWTALKDDIFGLQSLEALYISSDLRVVSPRISELQNLRILLLPNNQLLDVPQSLAQLQKLETLDLSGNYLERVPLFLLDMPALKLLNLSQNTKNLVDAAMAKAFADRGVELHHD
jgi:Leucine-rich repeat (LRR) protein